VLSFPVTQTARNSPRRNETVSSQGGTGGTKGVTDCVELIAQVDRVQVVACAYQTVSINGTYERERARFTFQVTEHDDLHHVNGFVSPPWVEKGANVTHKEYARKEKRSIEDDCEQEEPCFAALEQGKREQNRVSSIATWQRWPLPQPLFRCVFVW
jgi:hypothetical protein